MASVERYYCVRHKHKLKTYTTMRKLIYSLGALALMMVGCTEPITITQVDSPESEQLPITISMDLGTRVTDAGYEAGDKVGLYVVNTPHDLQTTGNHVDNMGFSYDGNGTWTPDTPIYWADQHTTATFYCYYPYNDGLCDKDSRPISVRGDQSSLEGYKASEFLWGKVENVSPTEEAVAITTNHVMANMAIYLKPGKGFTEDSLAAADKEVYIHNVMVNADFSLATGAVTANGDCVSVTPYAMEDHYRALIVPQTIATDTELVTIEILGVTYTFKAGKDITLKSNKRAKFTITINKINNGVNVGVGEWDEDDEDYGGIAD